MTLIELGEVSPGSDQHDEPRERPFRRVEVRRSLAVLITMLCLIGVAGSERPDAPGLPALWSVPFPGDWFAMTTEGVYVVQPGEPAKLTSYVPRTGEVRWSTTLPAYTGWFSTDVPGLLLMPSANGPDPSLVAAGAPRTKALDAATGAVRWEADGEVSLAGPDTILLAAGHQEKPEERRLRLIRTSDGSAVWELKPEGGLSGWTTIGPERKPATGVATVNAGGRLEIRRYTDRTLIATGTVPWTTPAPDGTGDDYAYVFGTTDTLFVVRSLAQRQEIFAYDAATMTRLWELQAGVGHGVFPCGRVMCVSSENGGVRGLEPRTGRRVWASADWDWARPMMNGQLIGQSRLSSEGTVIDPATGRVVAELGEILDVVEVAPGRLLVLSFSRGVPMDVKISELGPDHRPFVRDVLHGVGGGVMCQTVDGLVACGVSGGGGVGNGGDLTIRDAG